MDAIQGFAGTREHAHLFSWNNGSLANILREQENEAIFREKGTYGTFENPI